MNGHELGIVDGRTDFGKCPKIIMFSSGWNLKGIRETFGVPIYDPQLAVCVSTPIESMILHHELSLRVLVSSKSNLVAFGG